ncbi:MAG: hypothetical protein R3D05_08160 [Dongiaceae bacterium]
MPWLILPILPLFTCYLAVTSGITVWPAYLLVPVAAWLGRRYGRHGAITVAAGAVAVAFLDFELGPFAFGGALGLSIVAIWIAIVCSKPNPLDALAGGAKPFRSLALFVVALVVLPISKSLEIHEFDQGGALRLSVALQPFFLFALFLFGLAGFPPRRAVIGLAAATFAGMAIRIFRVDAALLEMLNNATEPESTWFRDFWFRYQLNDLGALATGLASFFTGRLVERWRAAGRLSSGLAQHPYLIVGGLSLLAALGTLATQLLSPLPEVAQLTGLNGDYDALIVASFLAGLLLGHRGTAFCLGLFVLLIGASNALAFWLDRGVLAVDIEQPVICLAYGMLGVAARVLLTGAPIPFAGKRWVLYGALVLAIAAIATSSSELYELAIAIATALGGAVVALLVKWLRRKLNLRGITITGEGWLPLAAIIVVVAWAVLNSGIIAAALLDLADEMDISGGAAIVVAVVLLHIPLAALIAGLATCVPKVWGDIRTMIDRR